MHLQKEEGGSNIWPMASSEEQRAQELGNNLSGQPGKWPDALPLGNAAGREDEVTLRSILIEDHFDELSTRQKALVKRALNQAKRANLDTVGDVRRAMENDDLSWRKGIGSVIMAFLRNLLS